MELLVDIGNSHIRWAEPQGLVRNEICSDRTANLQTVLHRDWAQLERPRALWVSSVADASLNAALDEWVRANWRLEVRWAKSVQQQLGVTNGYRNPQQLGVDRWMALIAARELSQQAVIIVDCGTATTIDAMDGSGNHLGGVILPGLKMMHQSLLGKTAIPWSGEATESGCFAVDTAGGIGSGALLATTGLVRIMLQATEKRLHQKVRCLLAGGGAVTLSKSLDISVQHEPYLVLKGLALVAKQEAVS